jgi:hypothetical protein
VALSGLYHYQYVAALSTCLPEIGGCEAIAARSVHKLIFIETLEFEFEQLVELYWVLDNFRVHFQFPFYKPHI